MGFDGNLDFVHGEHPHIQPGEKPPVFEGAIGGEYTTQDRPTSWPGGTPIRTIHTKRS